ncbi:uncharacterized protein LOC127720696 [Mytilus californianus]|uniref:uncharacterized protein LOC127720696 n=1 Tax=Mytilus californianus TaxID=6549 RepID=UPI002246F014|nr:uncharacterized protein LOC127720696 [Mytilus californianus]
MEMRPEHNRFTLYASNHLEIKKVITECLFQNHDLRLTSVAIILDDNRMKHIAQDIKVIKEVVYEDQTNPYLQILRIYIKSRTQFDGFLEDKCKEIDKELGKQGMTLGFVKRAASSIFRQKQLPPWKKVFLQGKDKQQYLVITGNSNDVMRTRKRLLDIVQKRKQPKVWYYVDTMKAKIQFNDHICKRLNLSGSAFEGEQVVKVKDEENQLWEFDLRKMKCTRDKITYTLKHEEVTESSVDPLHEEFDDTNRNTGLMEASGSIIKECTFEINPVLKQKQFKGKILKMLEARNINFNKTTLEITGSFEEMTSLNQQIINDFGIETGVFSKDETVIAAKHTNTQMKSNWKPKPDNKFQHVAEIKIPYMEYRMLKFFCPECQLFKGSPTYDNGVLQKFLHVGEREDELKEILQSKSIYFQSLTTFDVPMPEDWTITDLKLKEVETELNIISPEIFCFRSKDAKTLTLKGNQYEKLQMAKTKCEFILGIKQKGRGGRRDRVISTDPSYKKVGNEQMGNKSFSQSVTPSRSSFSQSFSGGSSTPSAPPPSAATFKTSEGLLIHVYEGNILNLKVDCIVNAANESLSHGGGVADVISRAAGYGFQQESDDYIQRHGQLMVTECCTTSAGSLPYQCVIHAVGPRWYNYTDKRKCANDLEETVKNCFHEAEKKMLTSVAIPAISSGIFGVPREVCCTQYCNAVKNYSNIFGRATCLREIHFMDKDTFMVGLIQKEFKQNLNIDQSFQSSGSRVSNTSGHSLSKNDNTPQFTRSLSDDAAKAGKYSGSTNGKNSNPNSTVKQEKFQKQYMTAKGFKVHVVQDDITKMSVDIIICPQDDYCLSKGRIAKAIANASNERYRTDVLGMKTVKRCEVKKIAASPSTLPFKYVLHTVAPRWDKDAVKDNAKFMKELGLTIRNILKHCSDSKNISTAAIPVLGIGADGHDTPYVTYASILSKEISQELQNDKFSMHELYIVTSEWGMALAVTDQLDKEILFSPCTSFQRRKRQNKDTTDGTDVDKDGKRNRNSTTGAIPKSGTGKLGTTVKGGNLEDCVICMDTPDDPRRLQCGHVYCHNCISQHFKVNNPVCPTCGSIQGVVTGNQPPGTMKISRRFSHLAGYPECGRIEIEYIIDSGRQGPEHIEEGRRFEGIRRIGYLPDNRKGQLVAKMLRVAFDRKLVFTIGDSRTTGKQGVVTWNDIHHKTNPKPYEQFGYPDDTYLDRVIDELSAKGVTEKDIGPNTAIY